MKKIGLLLVLALSLSVEAFASEKVCDWYGGNQGSKGDRLNVTLTAKEVSVKSNGGDWDGTYPRAKGTVSGQDGVEYITYDVGYNDGQNTFLVDPALLKKGTKGKMRLVGRGEGYFEAKYFCHDDAR
jgi:hypothetical protein